MEKVLTMIVFSGLPLLLVSGFIRLSEIRQKRIRSRRPVSDKLLRAPGESLRIELTKLQEKFAYVGMLLTILPMAFVVGFEKTPLTISLPIYGICVVPIVWWAMRIRRKWSHYDMAWSGERAVAEELNQLMLEGYYVYHDFPKPDKSNIDHIIIGPSGIYVIETKTRRKKKARNDREEYKIVFDGKVLQFPNGYDDWPLRQVRENAAFVSDQLSKALAEPISATPILTYPGWFIELKAKPPFPIVNSKQIAKLVSSNAAILSRAKIERAKFYIEEKCRTVEF